MDKLPSLCATCGNVFYVYPSQFRTTNCSKSCGYIYRGLKAKGRKLGPSKRKGHVRVDCWCGVKHNFGGLRPGQAPSYQSNPELKARVSEKLRQINIERGISPNLYLSKNRVGRGYVSYHQRRVFKVLRTYFPDAVLELNVGRRWLDVAIPSLKVDVEYDGDSRWHDREKDSLRDEELSSLGWKTVRVTSKDLEVSNWITDLVAKICSKANAQETPMVPDSVALARTKPSTPIL